MVLQFGSILWDFPTNQINTIEVFSRDNSRLSLTTIEMSINRMIKIRQNQTAKIVRKYQDATFLICNSCFWCASCISADYNHTEQCPNCSTKMESIPISEREAYQLNIDSKNVSLEFWTL
jgi:hypothetical protein